MAVGDNPSGKWERGTFGRESMVKKIGKVGYWATSNSTVRTTVFSNEVIKMD